MEARNASEKTVLVGGSPVWVRVKGEGLPLLMLEGWGGGPAQHYFGLQDKLAGMGYRVLLPELPGTGGRTASAYVPRQQWAEWVGEVKDAEIPGQFVLVSHSLSAMIAIECLKVGSDCIAAVFISPWLVRTKLGAMLLRGTARVLRFLSPLVFAETKWVRDGRAWATALSLMAPVGLKPMVPCLAIWGKNDLMRRLLPACKHLGCETSERKWDHSPQIRATDDLALAIDRFVRRHWGTNRVV
jgi:pimeloyl-ACP methyl ester carboxylesterase